MWSHEKVLLISPFAIVFNYEHQNSTRRTDWSIFSCDWRSRQAGKSCGDLHRPLVSRLCPRMGLCKLSLSRKRSSTYEISHFNRSKWVFKQVVLINVRKTDASIGSYVHPTRIVEEFDPKDKELRAASVELLKGCVERLREKRIAYQAIALVGDPKGEIIRKVKDIRADVLLMGSRNLGTVQR